MADSTRFSFNAETELALVRVVALKEVHVCDCGNISDEWEAVLNMFLATPKAISHINTRGTKPPQARTLQKVFKRLVRDHRGWVPKQQAGSGITEERTEYHTTLDRLIAEMVNKEESDSKAKGEVKAAKKRLQESGKEIRNAALKRSSPDEKSSEDASNSLACCFHHHRKSFCQLSHFIQECNIRTKHQVSCW